MQMNSWKLPTHSKWIMELSYWKVKIIAVSLGSHCSRTAYKYIALLLKHCKIISISLRFMCKAFLHLWENGTRGPGYFVFRLFVFAMDIRLKKIRVTLLESSNLVIQIRAWVSIYLLFKYIVINQEIHLWNEMRETSFACSLCNPQRPTDLLGLLTWKPFFHLQTLPFPPAFWKKSWRLGWALPIKCHQEGLRQ